jgi:hypothetical protein
MQQGSKRKKQAEARRRWFHNQAQQGGQNPQAQPQPQAAPVMETRPGLPSSIPHAQVQPHQATRRSGLPGSQPTLEQGTLAPMSGQRVPVTGGLPHQERVIQPRQTVPATSQADVTVILYSSGKAPVLLATQLDAIRRQTVQPKELYVHVDGSTGHDEKTLAKLITCRTPTEFGRHLRIALAREAQTRYIALLEEDACPGAHWLENAIRAMLEADGPELAYGPAVIACAGVLQGSEKPVDGHVVGPELPRGEQAMEVDFGRQGWLFATEFARVAESLPRVGSSSDSLGVLLAAAAQQAGVPTVVLGYGTEQSNWGALQPHQHGLDPADTAAAFEAYLQLGWEPPYTGQGLAPAQPAPQAPTQPTLPVSAKPGEVTERRMGTGPDAMISREFVLPPEQQTPDPSKARERKLDAHEQTPPPASAGTESLIQTPPPENAKTETIPQPTPPPQSGTGRR